MLSILKNVRLNTENRFSQSWLYYNSAGYSGVIFGLALIECFCSNDESRSVCGLFSVSTRLYPIILMILMQVVMPNISFLGHFSGIVAGFLVIEGYYCYLIPSVKLTHQIEERFSCLTRISNYVKIRI